MHCGGIIRGNETINVDRLTDNAVCGQGVATDDEKRAPAFCQQIEGRLHGAIVRKRFASAATKMEGWALPAGLEFYEGWSRPKNNGTTQRVVPPYLRCLLFTFPPEKIFTEGNQDNQA